MHQSVRLTLFGFVLICVASAPTKKDRDVDVYSFHINSTVISRYAVTVITSRVANRLSESKEINFEVKIPKNAFITKFRMTIEGKTYDGVVKKKEEAQQQYSEAVARGESAGLVSSVGRTLEEFKTSVTVASLSKVTFELTYEELLKRRLGKYELLIHAQPMQPVANFKIDVNIVESPQLSFLELKGDFSTSELASAITKTVTDTKATVNFSPTLEQQSKCEDCGENGLNGNLIIMYDVHRTAEHGELQTSNGYFFHSFAPSNVQRIPKNVVFIIDRSGSMHGRKIVQTRLAMLRILGDLDGEDNFGVITFDSQINVWKDEILQATEQNLEAAKAFVKQIQDRGSTDINSAVMKGVQMIKNHSRKGSASILILLTDGDPTSGETNIHRIQANVKEAIGGRFPLYCLGFGFDVNFAFLEKMALENNGVARRIYEDSDADLQLQGFYNEVATPLLTDIHLTYVGASNLTQTTFSQYYNGSEIVVVGQITDNNLETFQTEVIAISKKNIVKYTHSVPVKGRAEVLPQDDIIQRMWAFLTVKQLLEKELTHSGPEKEAAKKEALDLSLKYSFVTPVTSMVVTKPQENETQVAHKPKEGQQQSRHRQFGKPRGGGQHFVNYGGSVRKFAVQSFLPQIGMGLQDHYGGRSVQKSPRRFSPTLDLARESVLTARESVLDLPALPLPTISFIQMAPTTASAKVRILLHVRPGDQPYCFDIFETEKLQLLADADSEFSMNGEIVSNRGFNEIALHYKTVHHLTLTTTEIKYTDDQNPVTFVWDQQPTTHNTGSVSLTLSGNEMNVTMGNVRVSVFLHEKDGDMFLWPIVREMPTHTNVKGILGLVNKFQTHFPKALLDMAWDYGISKPCVVPCWLTPRWAGTQATLSDFVVSQL